MIKMKVCKLQDKVDHNTIQHNGFIIADRVTKPTPRTKTRTRQKTKQTTKTSSTNKKCSDIRIQ